MNSALQAFCTAFLLGVVIVLTKSWHGRYTLDLTLGVQKFHTHPTPRIGGISIFLAVWLAAILAQAPNQHLLLPFAYAGLPAFVFGLLEDITKRVSVSLRLAATTFSGVLGWAITGISISDVQVYGLDWMLEFVLFSVLFTGFAVGGIANAMNIIDGFNGLAGGTALIHLGGLGAIAATMGDYEVVTLCLVVGGAVTGFLILNWPFGKLFLGDGGAYFVGFCVAWIAVLLLARHESVSAWSPMLVCGYPILEVFFSIARRRRRKLSPGAPDNMHLHSLVKRRLVRQMFPSASALCKNSVTGAIMWLCSVFPAWVAVEYATDTPMLMGGMLCFAFVYRSAYARLTQFKWCFSPATLVLKHAQ